MRCRSSKPAEDFSWKHRERGVRDTYCRPCRKAYGREHYLANRQRYIDQSAAVKHRLRAERTRLLLALFETNPCVDCGERDPVVLEFDHVRETKAFDIGTKLLTQPWAAILAEIEKCDVVCANCHRRRTAQRLGSARHRLSRQVE